MFLGPRQIRKSGNAVFLEEYEVFWADFLPTAFFIAAVMIGKQSLAAQRGFPTSILLPCELSRCGILPHSREERQDVAAVPSCEVNGSISRVFAVLPEVAIRQRLTVFGRLFFVPQISKISLFLVHCATRTPRGLASSSCGILPHPWEERHSCRCYILSFRGFARSRRPATA